MIIIRTVFILPIASERYQVLVNLTEPRMIEKTDSFDMLIDDFSSRSDTELFTFAHEDIMNTSNFTELFNNAVADDYTSSLWDGDVALIIRVFNNEYSSPVEFMVSFKLHCILCEHLFVCRSQLTKTT